MSDTDKNIPSETSEATPDKTMSVDIYLLWRSAEHDKFHLQALFSPEAKFPFELVARLSDGTRQDQNPCIYRLQLNLTENANKERTVKHKNTDYSAKQYQLRISQKKTFGISHFEENGLRMIPSTIDSHHFLFNVLFRASSPGIFLFKIRMKLFQSILFEIFRCTDLLLEDSLPFHLLFNRP